MKKWFKGFRECPFTLTKRGKKKLTYLAMWHRMIALALVCCMAFTLLPATALATEEKPAVESEAEQGKEEPVTEEPVIEEPVKKELASQVTSLAVSDAPWEIGKNTPSDVIATLSADQTTLTITGTGEMQDWAEKSQVPWQKVMNNITTVTIAEGVTNIGNHAFFQCWKLNTITLPTTLTSIGNYAFYSCVGLNSIPIPEAVTTIGHSAFNNCVGLTSIPIPEGVTTIGNSAFIGCKALTSITIPEKVTAIEWSTFYGCDNLSSITIPEAVTAIGQEAFSGCSKLATVTMNFSNDKNSKIIDGSVFQGIKDKATINVNAKNDAKSFKAWSSTLSNAGTGTEATFTDTAAASTTLTNVPDNCMITAEYEAPPTETSWDIGKNNASDVKAVLSADQTTLAISGTGEMKRWDTSRESPWVTARGTITTVTIGEGVTNVGGSAFDKCSRLNAITLPATLTTIERLAFYECKELASISIPNRVTTIEDSAFYSCEKLASITIPEGMTAIQSSTFRCCKELTSITIPEGVTSIGANAFNGCSKLGTVTMNFSKDKKSKIIGWGVFRHIKTKLVIQVKVKSDDAKTFVGWSSTLLNPGNDTAAATFTDAKQATTTLTNVPSDCSITAEYGAPPIKGNPVTEEMIQTIDAQKYTGSVLEPALTVQDGGKMLTVGTDYTVTYDNNKNAGTATATISGAGNYTGTASKTFTINKADGTAVKGYAVPGTLKAITNITPMLSNIALDGKGDGTWSWAADQALTADNANAEQTFQATFTPTDSVNYEVVETGVKVAVSTISLAKNQVYRLTKGDVKIVEQLVTIVGATLKEGTDYKIKLTADKDNIVVVKDNEIQAKNVGVVRVLMDILIGTKKAVSEPLIVEVKSEQGGQSNNVAEEIKDLLNEVNQDGNTSGEIVNAIADATIRMDQKEKEKLSNETLKTLDELFQKANPNLVVKAPIIEQMGNTENQITQANISGIALAAGLTSDQIKNGSTVQLKIEQEVPFKVADSKKAQMQLKLTLLVNGQKTQLASPVIIDIQLDKNMEIQGLEIMHQHDDGKIDLLTEGKELTTKTFVINRNTNVLTMKVASFSTFTFTTNKVQVEAEKPLIPLTPPKPLIPLKPLNPGDGKTYKPSAVPTGDDTPIGAIMVMVLLGVVGMAGVIWTKKKNR